MESSLKIVNFTSSTDAATLAQSLRDTTAEKPVQVVLYLSSTSEAVRANLRPFYEAGGIAALVRSHKDYDDDPLYVTAKGLCDRLSPFARKVTLRDVAYLVYAARLYPRMTWAESFAGITPTLDVPGAQSAPEVQAMTLASVRLFAGTGAYLRFDAAPSAACSCPFVHRHGNEWLPSPTDLVWLNEFVMAGGLTGVEPPDYRHTGAVDCDALDCAHFLARAQSPTEAFPQVNASPEIFKVCVKNARAMELAFRPRALHAVATVPITTVMSPMSRAIVEACQRYGEECGWDPIPFDEVEHYAGLLVYSGPRTVYTQNAGARMAGDPLSLAGLITIRRMRAAMLAGESPLKASIRAAELVNVIAKALPERGDWEAYELKFAEIDRTFKRGDSGLTDDEIFNVAQAYQPPAPGTLRQ